MSHKHQYKLLNRSKWVGGYYIFKCTSHDCHFQERAIGIDWFWGRRA